MPSEPLPRRLFLETPPSADRPPVLAEGELHHARDVLRLGVGDRVLGLDGEGGTWPLVVASVGKRGLELACDGEVEREPRPGSPGSRVPWVEVVVSLPKGGRAEEMVDRLTQLGVSRVTPLVCERTPPHGRELSAGRRGRLERVAREACKQAIRGWVPEVGEPCGWGEVCAGGGVVLVPGAGRGLWEVLRGGGSRGGRWRLVVGPEGGFTGEELERAWDAGLEGVGLGPYVSRIETAAELACGMVVCGG